MDWIFIVFCFPRKKKWDSCYFIQLFPLFFHKNPDCDPEDTLVKATEACKRTPLRLWSCFTRPCIRALGLISWLHVPSSLQDFFLLPSCLEFCRSPSPAGSAPFQPGAPTEGAKGPWPQMQVMLRSHGAVKQLCPILWSWRAEPRRGWLPLHHTDVGSNHCCLSTEAASFSHGGERKPEIWTVTRRLAHCYGLGQRHIYNSCCDIVLSV